MSPLKTEAERTPHAQCRTACTEAHRWFNTGDGVGGLKYWCKGPAALLDPWDQPATPQRMTQDELDAICDTIREAMYDDKALLPDLFWYGLSSLGAIASTGTEADNRHATQTLRQMVQRAKDGVPMNERGEHL